jgi:1-acyl-sn-glycerol-3-phosphate acyltransferase
MTWFYHLANAFFRLAFRILFDYRVHGLENVPREGPLIVAINHASFADPLMAGAFIPRHITMMGKVELFRKPIFGLLVRMYGAFPVRRGEGDLQAVRRSLEVLRSGGALLLAPEGTRSKDGKLQRGREGTALIALRTGATILPVAIWGPKYLWKNLARLRRTKVEMVIGEPFRLESPSRRPNRQQLRELTDEIMRRIAILMPPELRGAYGDQVGEVPGEVPQKQRGEETTAPAGRTARA